MKYQGFTLLELLITLTILGILITVGGPSFVTQINNNRVKTTALSLFESIELARTKAVASNTRAVLKHNGNWEAGWDVFIDSNNDGSITDEQPIASVGKTSNVRILPNKPVKNYISFIGTGESRTIGKSSTGAPQMGSLMVCPPTEGSGYKLILSKSGRMRMEEINSLKCRNVAIAL